jgi:hypothetical protein
MAVVKCSQAHESLLDGEGSGWSRPVMIATRDTRNKTMTRRRCSNWMSEALESGQLQE